MIQYKQVVIWDSNVIDVGFLGSEQSVPKALRGLASEGIYIVTGAPAATVGQWIPAAQIKNAVDGTTYENTGTTAAPVWTLLSTGGGGGISALTGDVTASGSGSVAATIAANAVTTAKILNANVTLAKLAAGIAPSHVVKFAGKITWSGSGASLTTTVTGVAATDIVVATIQGAPTQAAYIASAAPTTNTVTIVLSAANTSNDAVISYEVLRAAS